MNTDAIVSRIIQHFPDFHIRNINLAGEGTANIAYEINIEFIFRFPKNQVALEQLKHELAVQPLLNQHISLPTPQFLYVPSDGSFVGYKKLEGVPMLYKLDDFSNYDEFYPEIGKFFSELHSISSGEYSHLGLRTQNRSLEEWRVFGERYFQKTKHALPSHYYDSITEFFNSEAFLADDLRSGSYVLCHNDLGVEHILINNDEITGIIDWGDVTLADPACDLARIYRDLGPKALDKILLNYVCPDSVEEGIRERAMFFGKCLFFEDLHYGLTHKEYLKKSLRVIGEIFEG